VRCVALKLIANGESHALRSREAAQLGASGLGSEARGGGEEGGVLVGGGARLRKGTREKSQRRCVLPECQQGTMEEST